MILFLILTQLINAYSQVPTQPLASEQRMLTYKIHYNLPVDPSNAVSGSWRKGTRLERVIIMPDGAQWLEVIPEQLYVGFHRSDKAFYLYDLKKQTRQKITNHPKNELRALKKTKADCGFVYEGRVKRVQGDLKFELCISELDFNMDNIYAQFYMTNIFQDLQKDTGLKHSFLRSITLHNHLDFFVHKIESVPTILTKPFKEDVTALENFTLLKGECAEHTCKYHYKIKSKDDVIYRPDPKLLVF